MASLTDPVMLMARYNAWANHRFTEYFSGQDPELVEAYLPGSFPSIRKTLMHIWDAQYVWFKRLHGESPTKFLSESWTGNLEDMYAGLNASSAALVDLTASFDPSAMDQVIDYATLAGGPQSSRRYEILLHIFNHSMYHRGQCVTMARMHGLTGMPSTDLVKFLRS